MEHRYIEGWFLGTVCTMPDMQRRGLATQLLSRVYSDLARRDLPFSVLNCGEPLVGFYERSGYRRIADRATYLRGVSAVVDDDPAMATSLSSDFDVASLVCDSFPFGFDF